VSVRTIRHRLQTELGLPARHAAKKPFLNERMRKKRIIFCQKYITWTADDWKKVLFSDESTFLTFRTCPKMVRRPKGSDRMNPKYTLKTMKHPPSVMVWGCFSYNGVGNIHFLPKNTTMNGVRYLSMLQNKIPTAMEDLNTSIFMQDGAPCHTSKIVKNWLHEAKIELLDWPGNSPDLNPIENLWHIIKKEVEKRDTGSLPKLELAIRKVWRHDISVEHCENLVNSMPKRLRSVLDNKGEMTKY
jgi:transposase